MTTYELGYRIRKGPGPSSDYTTPYIALGSWDELGEAQLAANQLINHAPSFEVRIVEVRHTR